MVNYIKKKLRDSGLFRIEEVVTDMEFDKADWIYVMRVHVPIHFKRAHRFIEKMNLEHDDFNIYLENSRIIEGTLRESYVKIYGKVNR